MEILGDHRGWDDEAIAALRAAATGYWAAASRLAELMAGQDRADELRAGADSGDWVAAYRLAELLAGQDRADEAIQP